MNLVFGSGIDACTEGGEDAFCAVAAEGRKVASVVSVRVIWGCDCDGMVRGLEGWLTRRARCRFLGV